MSKRHRSVIGLGAAVVAVGALIAFAVLRACRPYAESAMCGNCMASIGCVALLWAEEHDGHLPPSLRSMSKVIASPRILICPGDRTRKPAKDWSSFTASNSSYELVRPTPRAHDTDGVFLRCKVHGHLGYADATVFDGQRRRTKVGR